MSIERNVDWGDVAPLPDGIPSYPGDAHAITAITAARRDNQPVSPFRLTGGDLYRTLGGAPAEGNVRFTIDLGAVLLDGKLRWFLSHLVARNGWLRGRITIVANAAFLGERNIAPRAHPNDGKFDLLDITEMSVRQRGQARRRARTGTHVPHPGIIQRRVGAVQLEFDPRPTVYLDGVASGKATNLAIRVEPNALEVWL